MLPTMSTYDLFVVVSCYAIPLPPLYLLQRCSQTISSKYRALVLLFVVFMILSGSTHAAHVLSAANSASLPFSQALTALTAAVGVMFAFALALIVLDAVTACELTDALQRSLHQTVKELDEAKQNAQAANENKTEFMAFLCHEIRNPLHVINANVDFLSETSLSVEQTDYVRSILDNGKLMAHIVNDVLDISRLSCGQMTLETIPVDLHDLTSSLLRNIRHQAAIKQVDLKLDYAAAAPKYVLTDPTRVHQLLLNLLSNAFKFTNRHGVITLAVRAYQHNPINDAHIPKGARKLIRGKSDDESDLVINESTPPQPVSAVSLSANNKDNSSTAATPTTVSPESSSTSRHIAEYTDGSFDNESSPLFSSLSDQDDDDEEHEHDLHDDGEHGKKYIYVQLEVSDSGVGISSSLLPQLFNPYTQAKMSTVREHGGTGLGLSIVHQIIKNMRGHIRVHSRLGHGSTFTITLKVQAITEQQTLQIQTSTNTTLNDTSTEEFTPVSSPDITATPSLSPRVASDAPIPVTAASHTVLVVDDNDVNRKILSRMLASLGYRVVLCCDGLEAVAAVRSCPASDPFLCVFMDISMPNMDGYEATRHIRAGVAAADGSSSSSSSTGGNANVYIIALTANALADERLKAKECGMNDFATKPIRKSEIAKLLQKLCCTGKRSLLIPPPSSVPLKRTTSSLMVPMPVLTLSESPLSNPRSTSDPSAIAIIPFQVSEEDNPPSASAASPDKRHNDIRASLMEQSFAVKNNKNTFIHPHTTNGKSNYNTPLMSTVRLPLKQPQLQQQQ